MIHICLILFSLVVGCYGQCESGNFPNGAECVPGICAGCVGTICCSPDGDRTATTPATTLSGITVSTSAFSFATVSASPGCIGPCFDNSCPTGFTCNTVTQECCSGQTTSSPITSCRDLIGPKGYSDCPRLAYLCNNTTYYDIMTQQCPRTCNRCNTFSSSTNNITSSSNCVDKTNLRTGFSDCPQLAYLCNNAAYSTLMTQQCPKTCGKCSSNSNFASSSLTSSSINGLSSSSINGLSNGLSSSSSSSSCIDRTNGTTGISDCSKVAYLCNNPAYRNVMTQQCPKTCGRCNSNTILG